MSILHRVEKYGDNHIEGKFVNLSFDTKFRKHWQCRVTNTGLHEFAAEPPLHSLTGEEQKAIKEIAGIVYYFTHDEWPEGLSCFSA